MATFTHAAEAVHQLQTLYQEQIEHLRSAMQAYVEGQDFPQVVRAWYPLLRIHAYSVRRPETSLA